MKEVVKIGLWAMFLIGVVVGLGHLVGSLKSRKWQGVGRYTIIKPGDQIILESIDPKTKIGVRLVIPDNAQINTLTRRGQWKPKSLVALADKFGWEWMGDSVAYWLGIGYTDVWNRLGIWDRIAWWNLARQADWENVDLGETNLVVSKKLADDQTVLGIADIWGPKARELFYASDLVEAGGEVRIYNSTGQGGLAARAAAVLESAGVRVIQVGQKETDTKNCEVRSTTDETQNLLVKWIIGLWDCRWVQKDAEDDFVDVYLGYDYAKRFDME